MKADNMKWDLMSQSVTGASHLRKGTECQDYSLSGRGENGEYPLILTVADGHGGAKHFRSAQGAVFACETAMQVAYDYTGAIFTQTDANLIKQIAETRIKVDIVRKWQQRVLEHAKAHPFAAQELTLLDITPEQQEAMLASEAIEEKEPILSAYGATLLMAIVLEDMIICEQIGDGDILFYYKTKNQKHRVKLPVEKDDALFANETTSLCSLKAPFYFRHSVTYLYDADNRPNLIMLATDGYANSFATNEAYHKAPADYYKLLKDSGADYVKENIEAWLNETSAEGSGDDITIVLAWRQ